MPALSKAALRAELETLAAAARAGLEGMTPAQRGIGFESFPRGTCGPVSELMGRLVLERLGVEGTYVCGSGHPLLREHQSHAWLEVGSLLVDLTYDQFADTGLSGWVFEDSLWHSLFQREEHKLCLQPSNWMQYPHQAYAAMQGACARRASVQR
jgi:hypothetical protein